ncbi:MAG TPA: FmdB family transcriptional regulator [Deltaproteobacteria bacterium]|nr:FmdB family transcriptional regulator [Deltaproteobacteria bacterium]
MPIYEYSCNKCGAISELLMLGKDDRASCKECGSDDLTKLMSAHNTTAGSSMPSMPEFGGGGCCGSPGTCGMPGSCCGG